MDKKPYSRKEVIDMLLHEIPPSKKFEKFIVIIEYKKKSNKQGFTKVEIIQNGKVFLRGGGTQQIINIEEGFDWSLLKVGENYIDGYYLDTQKKSIASLFKEGLTNALKNGRIPFFPKGS